MRGFTLLLTLAGLAACVAATPPLPPEQDSCGAGQLQGLVGQPAAALQAMRFSQPLRVIGPDTMVTLDYNADRLNIHVDEEEKISRVVCG